MHISSIKLQSLIEQDLSTLSDARVIAHLRSLLVSPDPIMRDWDYGVAGQQFLCWTVLAHPTSNTGIAYCERGFGPSTLWGLVTLSGTEQMSIGMDSGWFFSFLDAYFDSFAATDLSIWQVFKQEGDEFPGTALTIESSWDTAWQMVEELRLADPESRYHCSQSIRLRSDFEA